MSDTATKLLTEALTLSPDERVQLAHQILDSIDGEKYPIFDDPEFQAELNERLEAVSKDSAELISWDVARVNLHAELQRRRLSRQNEGGK
jgi:putative addiction module component (TIGR02574 family)